MTPIRLRAAIGVAALTLLALNGCSPSGTRRSSEPAEPAVDAVPTLLVGIDLRLPVQDYLPTAEQSEHLSRARLALIRICLSRFGVAYLVTPVPNNYGPRSLTDRRYGITDIELARTAGYGLGSRDPARMTRPPRPVIGVAGETALTGQGRSVVNGLAVPDGGCIGEADRTLDGAAPPGSDLRKGSQLQFQSFEASKRDSRVRAAFAQWSACMGRAGYQYADPLAAAGDPAFTNPPGSDQLAIAVTDIECKARTNLVGVWFAVESAYQRRSIDADREGFEASRAAIAARDRIAVAVGG